MRNVIPAMKTTAATRRAKFAMAVITVIDARTVKWRRCWQAHLPRRKRILFFQLSRRATTRLSRTATPLLDATMLSAAGSYCLLAPAARSHTGVHGPLQ